MTTMTTLPSLHTGGRQAPTPSKRNNQHVKPAVAMILRKRDGRRRDDTTTNDGRRTPDGDDNNDDTRRILIFFLGFQIPPIFCISQPPSLKKNLSFFFGFSDPANFLHQRAT